MNAQEREAFWKTLCALPGLDLLQDAKQLMAAIRFPKLLFRYRPVNLNSLEALRTNRLYFSSANYYDDPFDTFLHIDINSIHQEFLTAFQTRESTEAVTEGVKDILGGMLTEEQKAFFTADNVTKMAYDNCLPNEAASYDGMDSKRDYPGFKNGSKGRKSCCQHGKRSWKQRYL